ncbi:TPA: cellulose biosynthesis protein BcsC, partial [Serratia fonticola]
YWRLVARLPGQELAATQQLQALDRQYPGNITLRMALARMLFSQDRDAQAYELLQQVAADPAGRGSAADLWLEQVKALPVSPQSVAALNRFLGVFESGEQALGAQQELARQRTLLADPAYRARMT